MLRSSLSWRMLVVLPVVLAVPVVQADAAPAASSETSAEKAYRALRKPCDLEINARTLADVVNQLREQTGLNFMLDRTMMVNPLTWQLCGNGLPSQQPLTAEIHEVPLGDAVRRLLRSQHLTYAVAGDTVWITAPEQVIERQLEQTVSVDAEDEPLAEVLRGLARRTGANLLLDHRMKQHGQEKITLHLQDVSLATAVELLAEEAGLRPVRLDNVLYVTHEERAEKLRKSQQANRPTREWQWSMDEKGAIRMSGTGPLPLGLPQGVGLLGGGGIQGGLGALGAVGGALGALGGGNFQGGAIPQPPPPATQPKAPAKKPDEKKPEIKPGPGKPTAPETKPKEKPAAEALLPQRSETNSSRRRRG